MNDDQPQEPEDSAGPPPPEDSASKPGGAADPKPTPEGNSEGGKPKKKSFRGKLKGRHNPARNAIDNFSTSLVTIPLIAVSNILVARTLGPELRGIFQFLLLFRTFFVPLTLLGFGGAITYYMSNRQYSVKDTAFTSIGLGWIQGLVATGLVLLLWKLHWLGETADQISDQDTGALLIMAALMPLHTTFLYTTRILQGDSRFALQNRLNMAREIVLALFMLLLVVVLDGKIWGATIAVTFASIVVFLMCVLSLWWIYRPRFRIDLAYLKDGTIYGLRGYVGNLAAQANFRLDQVVLGYFCKADALGWYAIASRLTERLWMIPDALSFVVFNKVTADQGKKKEKSAELIAQVHRPLVWMMIGLSVVLGVLGFWLIPLIYGQEYWPATYALLLLLPGSVAVTTARILNKYFSGKGRPELNAYGAIIGSIASLAFYPAFILYFSRFDWFSGVSAGFLGAAIACTVIYSIVTYSKIWLFYRHTSPKKPPLYSLSRSDITWAVSQIRRGLGRETKKKNDAA